MPIAWDFLISHLFMSFADLNKKKKWTLSGHLRISGLDVYIGLPLSENYRTATAEQSFLSSLEDWNAFLFDGAWKAMYLAAMDGPFSKLFKNIVDPPVRVIYSFSPTIQTKLAPFTPCCQPKLTNHFDTDWKRDSSDE